MTIFVSVAILLVGVVVLISVVQIYNALIALKNQVDRAWANIDVILKQRFDEIPQIVQILEQFVKHEKSIIERLLQARQSYLGARGTSEKMEVTREFNTALSGLLALGEAYPELKSNTNFIQLQSRLSQLEDQIADRREFFNDAVTNLNTRIDQFPDVFLARMLGYARMAHYTVSPAEKALPNLKLNLG